MASHLHPIKLLPPHVIAKVNSSVTITDLNTVVLGLVKNSLDAGAQRIEATVDFARGACCIEDDGIGIAPREFSESGGLGQLHHTAKHQAGHQQHDVHGGDGIFLASLSALSLLTISSKHKHFHSQNSLTLHEVEVIERQLPSASFRHLTLSQIHGTRVTVRNLFGSLPVRVKQRDLLAQSSTECERCWQSLSRAIFALLIAWPGSVSLHMKDSQDPSHVLSISGSASVSVLPASCVFVSTDRACRTPVLNKERCLSLLSQAGRLQPDRRASFIPVSASTSEYILSGLISNEPSPTKHTQFISIGIHPCNASLAHSALFDAINDCFDNSDFGADHNYVESEGNLDMSSGRIVGQKYVIKHPSKTCKKGPHRWPMFCIRIEPHKSDHGQLHNGYESQEQQAHLTDLVKLLQVVARKWLESHHLRPARSCSQKRPRNMPDSPGTRHFLSTDAASSRPSRTAEERSIKSADGSRTQSVLLPARPSSANLGGRSRIKSSDKYFFERPWSSKGKEESLHVRASALQHAAENQTPGLRPGPTVELLNCGQFDTGPQTLSYGKMDPGTTLGSVDVLQERERPTLCDTGVVSKHQPRVRDLAAAYSEDVTRRWVDSMLLDWKSPLFAAQRETSLHTTRYEDIYNQTCRNGSASSHSMFHEMTPSRMSKDALRHATIIAQVDRKYVLATVPGDPKRQTDGVVDIVVPVLIDQHAASERCILEDLLAELCKPAQSLEESGNMVESIHGSKSAVRTSKLRKPILFDIAFTDGVLFERHAAGFANWGILYSLKPAEHHAAQRPDFTETLSVNALPPTISERCIAEPRILIDFLRTEVFAQEERGQGLKRSLERGEEVDWLKLIGSCPGGILDMLNSRACRSAIMFNDELSRNECKHLVQNLANCRFPFMCAHGRVSMVPLTQLAGDSASGIVIGVLEEITGRTTDVSKTSSNFVDAFKQWRDNAVL